MVTKNSPWKNSTDPNENDIENIRRLFSVACAFADLTCQLASGAEAKPETQNIPFGFS